MPRQAKCVFEHSQKSQIQIILLMHKVLSGPLLSVYTFCGIQWICNGQWRPWSDCAIMQTDMGLRCPHMPEDTFLHVAVHMSQRPIKRRPAKTQTSLRTRAVWSESSLIACAFFSLQAIKRGINENPCHTGWMYRLNWDFAGHTGLIVGFVLRFSYNTFIIGFWAENYY